MREQAPHALEVGTCIHSGMRRGTRDFDADAVAMGECAQLLERFELLDERGLELSEITQEGATIGIDAEMTIHRQAQRNGADAVRVFIIASHYRSPLTFAEEALDAARKGAERLREAAFAEPRTAFEVGGRAAAVIEPGRATAEFIAAMDEDLNSSKALASLFDLSHRINRARDEGFDRSQGQVELRTLAEVLGLILQAPAAASLEAAPFIDLLISLRTELRVAKQWALADRVRDGLADLGVELKDSPQGPTWSLR